MTFSINAAAPWVITQFDSDDATISSIKEDPANQGSQTLIEFTGTHNFATGDLVRISGATPYDGHHTVMRVVNTTSITIGYVPGAALSTGTVKKGDNMLTDMFTDIPALNLTTDGAPKVLDSFSVGPETDRYHGINMHDAVRIMVTGTLRIDEREELWIHDNVSHVTIDVPTGGLLIIGHQEMVNGALYRPDWCPLKFTKLYANNPMGDTADLRINGSLIQYGGVIYGTGMIYFGTDSTIHLIAGKLVGTRPTNVNRILSNSKNLHITDDYVTEGSYRFDFAYPPVQITGFKPAFTNTGTFRVRSGTDIPVYVIENYDAKGITFAGDCFDAAKLEMKNLEYEGELLITHNNPGTMVPVTSVTKEVIIKTVDIHGNPVEWARFYIPDFDNGNRPSTGTYKVSSQIESFDTDRIANNLTLRGGVTPPIKLLTRTLREGHSANSAYGSNNGWQGSSTTLIDYRSKNNSYDDLFDIHIWQYDSRYRLLEDVPMRGAGVLTITAELVPDPYVTATQDEANAYQGRFNLDGNTDVLHVTVDSNLDQLYDYLKALKIDINTQFDPAFEPVTYPSITEQIGTADGNTLDIGAVNLIVNDGVKLSVGKKFTSLRTTGTVTGQVESGRHDTTGITGRIVPEHAGMSIYYRLYDANNRYTDAYVTHADKSPFEIKMTLGGKIEAVAKAPRHRFKKFTVTADHPVYNVLLDREPHVRIEDLARTDRNRLRYLTQCISTTTPKRVRYGMVG